MVPHNGQRAGRSAGAEAESAALASVCMHAAGLQMRAQSRRQQLLVLLQEGEKEDYVVCFYMNVYVCYGCMGLRVWLSWRPPLRGPDVVERKARRYISRTQPFQ